MPTYDYSCDDCGHSFEAFQAMSEDPLSICPECGGKIRRLITGGTGIIFKGSGFYVTDNKKASSTITGKGDKTPDDTGSTQKGSPDSSGDAASGEKPSGKESPKSSGAGEKKEASSKTGKTKEPALSK